jgi:hypothetical protein
MPLRATVTHPSCGPSKVTVSKIGRVNYTTVEDILEGEQVLTGKFSLNGHPTIILFDSGASHDFISMTYTQKHQLVIEHIHYRKLLNFHRPRESKPTEEDFFVGFILSSVGPWPMEVSR